jgi:hypothetical protein
VSLPPLPLPPPDKRNEQVHSWAGSAAMTRQPAAYLQRDPAAQHLALLLLDRRAAAEVLGLVLHGATALLRKPMHQSRPARLGSHGLLGICGVCCWAECCAGWLTGRQRSQATGRAQGLPGAGVAAGRLSQQARPLRSRRLWARRGSAPAGAWSPRAPAAAAAARRTLRWPAPGACRPRLCPPAAAR